MGPTDRSILAPCGGWCENFIGQLPDPPSPANRSDTMTAESLMGRNLSLLSSVSFFSNLSTADLLRLESLLTVSHFKKDSIIFSQEDPGTSLFVIKQGRVKVLLYGESGHEITISWYGVGEFFGEMSLLDGRPRSASVVAAEPTVLLSLDREAFLRYLKLHPDASITILVELTTRLRHATDIIGNLALLDVYGRIGRVLYELGAKGGKQDASGILLRKITRHEIASLAGTSRETVSRTLRDFERRGLIKTSGRNILLHHQSFSSYPAKKSV